MKKKDHSKTESTPIASEISYVALVDDPFGIKTLEISHAQDQTDELPLDMDLDQQDSETLEAGAVGSDEESDGDSDQDSEGDSDGDSEELGASSEEFANSDVELKSLAQAMAEAHAAQLAADEKLVAHSAPDEDSETELARQIAEDQALAREMEEEQKAAEMQVDPELQAALPKEPLPQEDGTLDLNEMQSCLEALLFMSDKPISLDKLRDHLGPTFEKSAFEQALTLLQERYQAPQFGIEVVAVAGGYQFRTKAARAPLAKKLAKVQIQRLSSGAMETLAITAYRQPVMKEDIDKIRGVDSSYFVRGLLDRKLIKITGRSELPGRPMLYSTTEEFLILFGLKDLTSMPSLRELEQMIPTSQTNNPEEEDPKIKEMRRLVEQMKADNSSQLKYDPREDEKILKEIRERVGAIPSSTPYLDEQKRLEKEAALLAKGGGIPASTSPAEPEAQASSPDPAPQTLDGPAAPDERAPEH